MAEHTNHSPTLALDGRAYTAVRLAGSGPGLRCVPVTCGRASGLVAVARSWPARPDVTGMLAVELRFGEETGTLYLPPPVHADCVAALFEGETRSTLPSDVAALILEAAAAKILDDLERRLGTAISLSGVSPVDPSTALPVTFALVFEPHDGQPMWIYADLPQAIARKIIALASGRPDGPAQDATEVDVAIRAGSSELTAEELRAIEAGDIIVFDRTPLVRGRALLVVAEMMCAFLDLEGTEPRVATTFQSTRSAAFAPHLQVIGTWFARGDQPFVVTADLARYRTPLETIDGLETGSSFPLPNPIDGPVELYIADLRIADGVLVRGEGWVGVRLTRVYAEA